MVEMNFLRCAVLGFLVSWSTKAVFILAFLASVLLTSVLALYLIRFVSEFVYCEIITAWHEYHRQPPAPFANPWPHWEVVAELRPSSNETIEQVICCDVDPIDDPLHPHVSIVYVVGVRKRNSFWRTITLWRVSTLTGERKRVCDFAYFDPCTFSKTIWFKAFAFQSRGVIFIHARHVKRFYSGYHAHTSLLVYDVRHKACAKVSFGPHCVFKYYQPLAIRCLGRRLKEKSIEGWRIRFLFAEICTALNELHEDHNEGERRTVFASVVADFSTSDSESFEILSREDLLFRHSPASQIRSVRKVGLFQEDAGQRIFVYDMEANRFGHFHNLAAFINSDEVFKKYYAKLPVMPGNLWHTFPGVTTDREVVLKVLEEPVLIRTSLQPPTLFMLAARALFKADPKVAKLNAAQFRRMTGVDLSGHFG